MTDDLLIFVAFTFIGIGGFCIGYGWASYFKGKS